MPPGTGLITLLLKEPDYSLLPASFRLLPVTLGPVKGSGCCLPAAAHSCPIYYSRGLFRVHNVEPSFTQALPGYLGLSNTPESKKTLSSSKPPLQQSSNAAFRAVLDGNTAPGPGNEEPFRVPLAPGSALFRQRRGACSIFSPVPIQPYGETRAFPHGILYNLLYSLAGTGSLEPGNSRFPSITAGTGSFRQ